MSVFFVQVHTEPVSESPETVTVDRWIPSFLHIHRVIVYASGTNSVSVVSYPVQPDATSVDRWVPTLIQPDRVVHYASGTIFVTPISEAPEATSADRWVSSFVQPGRVIRYADGTDFVGSLQPIIHIIPFDWLPTQTTIRERRKSSARQTSVEPFRVDVPSQDKWEPTLIQPDRTQKSPPESVSLLLIPIAPPPPPPPVIIGDMYSFTHDFQSPDCLDRFIPY